MKRARGESERALAKRREKYARSRKEAGLPYSPFDDEVRAAARKFKEETRTIKARLLPQLQPSVLAQRTRERARRRAYRSYLASLESKEET